jgi:hypothetical protein
MLIHREKSHEPRSKRRTGRREAQGHGTGAHIKYRSCISYTP